jgi:hypothetical protein
MARASILITPVMSELLARIQQVQDAARVTDLCSKALLLGLTQMAERTIVQDVTEVNKLDDFAQRMTSAGVTLRANPEGLARLEAEDKLEWERALKVRGSEPPKSTGFKATTFGVTPTVVVEVKPHEEPLGPPINHVAITWPVEPESSPAVIVEPEVIVEAKEVKLALAKDPLFIEEEPEKTPLYTPEELGQDTLDEYDFEDLLK